MVEAEEYRRVILELARGAGDELPEKGRTDPVLGLVPEVVGPAERTEALKSGLEARVAAPLQLPLIIDRSAGFCFRPELALG